MRPSQAEAAETDSERTGDGEARGFIREHALPLALIGAGVGWLLWSASQRRGEGPARPDYAKFGRSEVYDDSAEASDTSTQARLQDLKHQVEEGVAGAKRAASSTARAARDKVADLERAARDGAERAKRGAARSLADEPVVLGAVALGAGIAVGLALPATDSEDQWLGQYRDRVLSAAKDRVGQALRAGVESE